MSDKGQPPEAESAGVVRPLQAFFAACAQYASARLRLASMEGREAAGEAGKVLLLAGAALFVGVFGWLFVCLAVVFLMAKAMGENGWIWASLIMAAVHFVVAAVLGYVLRQRGGKAFFPLTTAEFQKDRDWLEKEDK
jgi:uncharacterized membrane protein YqjE